MEEEKEENENKQINISQGVLIFFTLFVFIVGAVYFVSSKTRNEKVESVLEGEKELGIAASPSILSMDNHQDITELQIEDIVIGEGEEAIAGKKVTVDYVGSLISGEKFDSSYDRGTPFVFNLGEGKVILGWDQGIVGMKVGGKRKLIVPPSLAYGERGAGGVIPPNAILVFEVELLKVE